MSGTARTHFAPALSLAVLAAIGLIRPGAASGQTVTGARALLNQTAAATALTAAFNPIPGSPTRTGTEPVAGERALLGRTETVATWELQLGTALMAQAGGEIRIDGERALLGRWPVTEPRYSGNWAKRGEKEPEDQS
jgi:hypothetical protein